MLQIHKAQNETDRKTQSEFPTPLFIYGDIKPATCKFLASHQLQSQGASLGSRTGGKAQSGPWSGAGGHHATPGGAALWPHPAAPPPLPREAHRNRVTGHKAETVSLGNKNLSFPNIPP